MDASDLCLTPATELGRLIRARKLSAVELTDAVLCGPRADGHLRREEKGAALEELAHEALRPWAHTRPPVG